MKFKIYCEECEYTFDNESELEIKNYIGRDYDLLCCPFCKSDSDLRLIVDEESWRKIWISKI